METQDIITEAKRNGICPEWAADFANNPTVAHLCERYFAGSDWAIEHDFPSIEMLRAFRGQTERHGIYTDYSGETSRGVCAFFGDSVASISASGYDVKSVIVRHNSALVISARDNAIIDVTVLDNARVMVHQEGAAQVTVYRYGGHILGNGKIIEKSFKKDI